MSTEIDSFDALVQSGRRKGTWKVSLDSEVLRLTSADGSEAYEISRAEGAEKIELPGGLLGKRMLVAHIPKRQVFQVESEKIAVLKEWLGPPTMLKMTLRRRLRWGLPIGILFIVTSLPLPGDPEAGVEGVPFDVVGMLLGVVLIGLGLMMKIRPVRGLLLVDSVWFVVLSGKVVYNMVEGSSWLWSILVVLLLSSAASGIRQYCYFGSMNGTGRVEGGSDGLI